MPLGFSLTDNPLVHVHDLYSIGSQSVVTFDCARKNLVVRAPLSGVLGLSVNSTWDGGFSAVGIDLLTLTDSVAQTLGGRTVSQPWFGRKSWRGTSPMSFNLPLRLLSRFDAHDEVYLPMLGLLALIYPRLDDDNQDSADSAATFSRYFVPGPNLFYNSSQESSNSEGLFGGVNNNGDPVKISLGKFMTFNGCYIKSLNFQVENSFNLEGYPHNVGVTVAFEVMDSSFVGVNGSFMAKGLGDQSFKLNESLTGLKEGAENALKKGEVLATDMGNTLQSVFQKF